MDFFFSLVHSDNKMMNKSNLFHSYTFSVFKCNLVILLVSRKLRAFNVMDVMKEQSCG